MESTAEGRIRLGTQGWGWSHWVGRFYPPGTRPEDFLTFYSRVFDTVEIDTTFYGIPKRSTVLSWAEKVPDGFRFAGKMPQIITHANGLEGGCKDLTTFLERMSLLGDKLGPLLVQLPPTFGYHNLDALGRFLCFLREYAAEFRFAVEFRNASLLRDDVVSLLQEHNVALCFNDLDWMAFPIDVTTDFGYIRWLGLPSRNHNSLRAPIDVTSRLIASVRKMRAIVYQVDEVYGFFNDRYGGHAPETANLVRDVLSLRFVDPSSVWPQQLGMFTTKRH